MKDTNTILQLIKSTVKASDPEAKVVLFGSYARGDYNEESDIDLLILLNKDNITYADEVKISQRKIKENISKLKDKGLIKRIGPDKGGHWEVL